MDIKLYNSLTRQTEVLKPIKEKEIGLYTCGPTVYNYAHIGNLRTFLFEDILKRVLEYNGVKVKHVMNITDVGHLTSDSDTGEDKLEKGAKRENKTVWEIAELYTNAFLKDIERLNLITPDVLVKATDTIQEQINLIKDLEKKGFTYKIDDGIYFDTSKLETYGRLWPQKMKLKAGARIDVVKGKKNETDFALWKFSPKDTKRQMEWDSPWGVGFPGWHTECVVMSMDNLGVPFDIHCGGVDHVLIHHTNEIAQCEAATGKPLCNVWMHAEHLSLKEGKMSKSEGTVVLIDTLIEKGIDPLAYRYLCLTTHYRTRLTFSWESLEASQNGLTSLRNKFLEFKKAEKTELKDNGFKQKFNEAINDDLDTPKALAIVWEMIKSDIPDYSKYELLLNFDKVLGLDLENYKQEEAPKEIKEIAEQRQEARKNKDWAKSDELRDKLKEMGWTIEDTSEGYKLSK